MLTKKLVHLRFREIYDLRGRILGASLSLAGLVWFFSRNWGVGLINAMSELPPARYEAEAASVFTSIFLAWVLLGALANFHLGWHFDLTKPLRSPLRPLRVFAAKTVCGLLGPWLLVVLPVLVAFAYRSVGPLLTLPLVVATFVFAMAANSAVGIAMLVTGGLTGRFVRTAFVFLCCLAFSLVALGSVRAVTMHDKGVLTRFSRRVAKVNLAWTQDLPPAKPMAALFRASRTGDFPGAIPAAAELLLFCAALTFIEYRLLRRVHVSGQPVFKATSTHGSGFLSGLEFAMTRVPERFRGSAVLLLREIKKLSEIPSVPILTLLFLCYCPVFVVFVPPPNVMALEMMCTLPVMIFTVCKGNLLGPDWSSARLLFAQPVSLYRVLAAKNAALDLVVGGILAATIVTGLALGTVRLQWWEAVSALCYFATLFLVWDMLAAYTSVLFPQPVGANRAAKVDSSASQFLMLLGPAMLLTPFIMLQFAARKTGHEGIAIAGCAGLLVFAAAFQRTIYRRWLTDRLIHHREPLYCALTQAGPV